MIKDQYLAYADLESVLDSNDWHANSLWINPTLDGPTGFHNQATIGSSEADFWYQMNFPNDDALLVTELIL